MEQYRRHMKEKRQKKDKTRKEEFFIEWKEPLVSVF